MLLAVLDLIATGKATPNRIEWSKALIERFTAYFEVVRTDKDKNTPENPFYYLRSEGFWIPKQVNAQGTLEPLSGTPLRRDADTGRVFASINLDFANFLDPIEREVARDILVSRYFPGKSQLVKALFQDLDLENSKEVQESDQAVYPTRSASFRKIVTEIYDYQCAACGLRIKINPENITFVDAAHLIPFNESSNDHPSNGIALCKNHHWAMDQRLIAPHPDGCWTVSKVLDARRSRGEENLIELEGVQILFPKKFDNAYAPESTALQWRYDRLLA